jgi:hypothetical protein
MEHHVASSGGGFTNIYSQARVAYYGISGIPNSYFDGITNVLGGSTNTYAQFLAKYNQRIAVPSNFTIGLNGMNEGLDYTVLLNMEMVEPYPGTNLVAHLALTQSHCSFGGSLYNFVTRLFVPNASGTPVYFTSNPVQTAVLQFTMNSAWVLDDCEFVAFIQDNSTKEILQATKVSVLDLMPMYFDNAACLDISMVPVTNCSGEVAPAVTISNQGASNLTTLEINYQVNDEAVNTYNWIGNLSYGAVETVNLPAISFNIQDQNNLLVYTSNPNGNPDEDPLNDTVTFQFAAGQQAIPDVYLFLKLDNNPGETYYELINSSGAVLYSGGPYTIPEAFIKDTFELATSDCYTFIIYDQAGNGLSDPGYFALRQSNFAVIYENFEFSGSEELVQFSVSITGIEEKVTYGFSYFPNPMREKAFVRFELEQSETVELSVFSSTGKVVYSSGQLMFGAGSQIIPVDGTRMSPGIYFVKLRIGDQMVTKKITRY